MEPSPASFLVYYISMLYDNISCFYQLCATDSIIPTVCWHLLQVLLWVLLSLLPLVEGAHMQGAAAAAVGSDSAGTAGLLRGQKEPELTVTLPEVIEDEAQEDDGAADSTWHPLYGTEAA